MTESADKDPLLKAAGAIVSALDGIVLGQQEAVSSLVAAYMAGGHVLLEGVPGIGKTLLARSLRLGPGPRLLAGAVHARPHARPT